MSSRGILEKPISDLDPDTELCHESEFGNFVGETFGRRKYLIKKPTQKGRVEGKMDKPPHPHHTLAGVIKPFSRYLLKVILRDREGVEGETSGGKSKRGRHRARKKDGETGGERQTGDTARERNKEETGGKKKKEKDRTGRDRTGDRV